MRTRLAVTPPVSRKVLLGGCRSRSRTRSGVISRSMCLMRSGSRVRGLGAEHRLGGCVASCGERERLPAYVASFGYGDERDQTDDGRFDVY